MKFPAPHWVNVAMFDDLNAAQLLRHYLERAGFRSRAFNDRLLQLFLFLCPPRATYRVQICRDDFKRASEFLATDPAAISATKLAIHCPLCGSLRIQYPQMTRKFLLPTLILHLGIIFRVIEHEAYCENCHHIWNLPKKHAPVPEKAHAVKT